MKIRRKRDIIELIIAIILIIAVIIINQIIDRTPKPQVPFFINRIWALIYFGCPLWILYILYRNLR